MKRVLVVICLMTALFGREQSLAQGLDHKAAADMFLKAGEPARAIVEYEHVLSDDPHSTAVYFDLAIAHYMRKDAEAAIQALRALVSLDPSDTEALYNLGCLMLYKEDLRSARAYFWKAFRQSGSHAEFIPFARNGLRFAREIERLEPPNRKAVCHFLLQSLPSIRQEG